VNTPLAPAYVSPAGFAVARIDEAACIGCALCIAACPVDAIVGAAKQMHTVLTAHCTGCALCVPPCPVECIAMVEAGRAWKSEDADHAGARHAARNARLARNVAASDGTEPDRGRAARRAAVAAALERARTRRSQARRTVR
jgi:electron transport complex protein RnfB